MDICNLTQNQHFLTIAIVQILIMLIEYFIGKSKRIESNSILEIILKIIFKRRT